MVSRFGRVPDGINSHPVEPRMGLSEVKRPEKVPEE
jgi:hypothetical protein